MPKDDLDKRPWTRFERATYTEEQRQRYAALRADHPPAVFLNSRYEVAVWFGHCEFGQYAHLSIKALDKSARHDWRELQRIKNELCGDESEGIELYPAESRLVDSANQYHLFVFRHWKVPVGFTTRLVAEGDWRGSRQRPFERGWRPPDCVVGEAAFDRLIEQESAALAERRQRDDEPGPVS